MLIGTGKTYCATHLEDGSIRPDLYRFRVTQGGFWNMYQGQKSMLVDEMKGNKMSPTEFNEVCDKYPLHVNIKGGGGGLQGGKDFYHFELYASGMVEGGGGAPREG